MKAHSCYRFTLGQEEFFTLTMVYTSEGVCVGVRCCAPPSTFRHILPTPTKRPTQPSTYPAPVEDGGRLEDPPGHIGHLVFDHDSKLTNIRICVKTGTSHLEKGREKRHRVRGGLCFLPEAESVQSIMGPGPGHPELASPGCPHPRTGLRM